jgi:uncharacterized Tic20 family protein
MRVGSHVILVNYGVGLTLGMSVAPGIAWCRLVGVHPDRAVGDDLSFRYSVIVAVLVAAVVVVVHRFLVVPQFLLFQVVCFHSFDGILSALFSQLFVLPHDKKRK